MHSSHEMQSHHELLLETASKNLKHLQKISHIFDELLDDEDI